MEVFFESNLRFWPQGATVTQLAASPTWPPCFAAVGYAPCLRAWKPEGEATAAQFSPVHSLLEVDGSNFVACCIQDGRLAAAESSGRIGIWDTATWKRVHTLSAGAEITALALSNAHVAVGTVCGVVMAWQCEAGSEECKQVFVARQVDTVPIRTVLLNHTKYAEGRLLVVHSAGRNSVNVWHLTERRLMHRLVRKTTPDDASTVVLANMQFAFLDAVLFAGVSWCEGHDPMIQLAQVVEAEMQDVEAPERLSGRGRPLAADFAGGLLAVGFEDGALAVFGRYGWLRWHGGSVGSAKVLSHRTQVVSGGADKQLCLWSGEGALLACVDVGFQITALACSDCSVVVGGAHGELQIAVLGAASEEQEQKVKAQEQQPERAARPQHCAQYDLVFDYRTSLLKTQDSGARKHGHVSSHPDVLAHYVRPRTPITAVHLAAHAAAKDGDTGAKPEPTEEQKEAAKRKSLQQMGEASSVARNAGAALPSNVDKLGEKCANPSCLTRSGAKGGRFLRCSSCKERRYCSQHCQRTHWRDGHSKECAELVRRRQELQRLSGDSNALKVGTNSRSGSRESAPSQAPVVHRQADLLPTAHAQAAVQSSAAQTQQHASDGLETQGSHASMDNAHQHTAAPVPADNVEGCSTGGKGGMQGGGATHACGLAEAAQAGAVQATTLPEGKIAGCRTGRKQGMQGGGATQTCEPSDAMQASTVPANNVEACSTGREGKIQGGDTTQACGLAEAAQPSTLPEGNIAGYSTGSKGGMQGGGATQTCEPSDAVQASTVLVNNVEACSTGREGKIQGGDTTQTCGLAEAAQPSTVLAGDVKGCSKGGEGGVQGGGATQTCGLVDAAQASTVLVGDVHECSTGVQGQAGDLYELD